MRRSEFSELAEHVFGPALARAYTQGLVLEAIGGLTAAEAIEHEVPVRSVWNALCDAMDVPESSRWEIPMRQRRR